jgi:hypothetical protein
MNLNYSLATATITCSPQSIQHATAIIDTGASDHYFTPSAPVVNIDPNAPKTTIRTSTGEARTSTGAAVLAIPGIPLLRACTGHIIPGFTTNLLSLGKLCEADCTAYIDKHKLEVNNKEGHKILHGAQEPTGRRLWRVDIAGPPAQHEPAPPTPVPSPTTTPAPEPKPPCTATKLHVQTLDLPNTPALIAYLHATAGYPVKQTWLDAIQRGAYASWPGLTYKLAARHCPNSDETLLGHMAQPRQHIHSTRTAPASTPTTAPPLQEIHHRYSHGPHQLHLHR